MMNPFWNMPSASVRKRSDNDEKIATADQKISPARSSSAKKQLPSIPKNAVPITKPISPPLSVQSTNGTHASYGPFYLEYSLLAEFTLVVKQKLPGVYVQPSYSSALMWFGVIFIRHGLYQDGVFKFTVYIPDNYPDGECPRLVFDIPVFHPLVDPISGELDVKRAFTKWRRNHNHIWQVLMYARRIFYKIDTTSPLNPEAAVLYEKDVQLFKSKVVDSVKLCNSHLFDKPKIEDPYAIIFSPWNPVLHDDARERMLAQKKKSEEQSRGLHVSGLSWVKPGSVLPFSKEENSLQT
ncbi:AKT-interacting protein homolog B isoform X1 [Xenopus laevis]|uniref:AKT-interacting protein homolog B isoform X1 n=1 Tax=Xenopus laevis TaxID=8355 RepID=A0A8J1N1K8_XENLA|nr:AKT-interacting protein homolog B isoform X1 [Xenopus laevis]XP_018115172.1 AKT-interacting protein homolog B isoform X1 [Xenopus laevis]XP_018115173.1 AKT-interacting protein homolog B isoform X1 [Xenopus laevis]XP_018115174.1 AKT-interacting protein homolog B isoform X1 [Xenopus laevis]XP_041447318.1 AKT-interacting protein homolog B isoform X1 [Xenopus laevis]